MKGHDPDHVCPLCDETAFLETSDLAEAVAKYRTRIEDETAAKIAAWLRLTDCSWMAQAILRGEWRGK